MDSKFHPYRRPASSRPPDANDPSQTHRQPVPASVHRPKPQAAERSFHGLQHRSAQAVSRSGEFANAWARYPDAVEVVVDTGMRILSRTTDAPGLMADLCRGVAVLLESPTYIGVALSSAPAEALLVDIASWKRKWKEGSGEAPLIDMAYHPTFASAQFLEQMKCSLNREPLPIDSGMVLLTPRSTLDCFGHIGHVDFLGDAPASESKASRPQTEPARGAVRGCRVSRPPARPDLETAPP